MNNTIFFHGTAADIKHFDKKYIGQNFEKDEEGFFFTTNTFFEVVQQIGGKEKIYEDIYSAGAYALNASKITGQPPVVYPVLLDFKNPLTVEDIIEYYCLNQEDPFDGCTPQDFYDKNTSGVLDIVKQENKDAVVFDWDNEIFAVVFSPEQIKFALS